MKNVLLLLASATALSLASCSQEKTTDTATTTTTAPGDSTATKTTTTTSDVVYKTRGARMADKFASRMKISDAATKEKLQQAFYNRSKRYDALMAKYQADTAGLGAARRQYYKDTDAEFRTILVVPAQYQAYESDRSTYDESNNLDTTDQSAAASSSTTPSADSSAAMPSSSTSTTTTTTTTTEEAPDASGAMVAKGKSKMTDGSKVKVKDNGKVKVKDADGNKAKM
ncbi:hypothetical protein [Hymenobacter sp. BRD67]|uniref:hypothetical protein n=1 Tax=Hymenobacter sp. BRD67 TaxID=2675877 RepID=UPI00156596D0|nr:hypothetical protein [Hymenobacter sp. BRD67]QKG51606.1 hypothetical protein GKZ67_02115 [Hymenobacter sp. BRD67]